MSAQSRAARLARVLDVQEKKRKLEEWKLADLVREEAQLAQTGIELLQTLGDQSLMQGLFLEAKASALKRNDLALAGSRERQAAARESLRAASTVEKRLERAVGRARTLERSERERTDLLSALDDHLAARAASFE